MTVEQLEKANELYRNIKHESDILDTIEDFENTNGLFLWGSQRSDLTIEISENIKSKVLVLLEDYHQTELKKYQDELDSI